MQAGAFLRVSALVACVALVLLDPVAAFPISGSKNVTTSRKALTDHDCYYDYRRRRCEPADQCQYRYRFLDATFGESCRLKGDKKHVKPIYKTKIMAHPGVIAGGATALFASDIAAIIFTPLLQNFPLTFNLIQGFLLCFSGDTYFQVLEQGIRSKKVGLKVWRAVRSGMIGALNNGFIHYLYYKWIDRRFPYHLFTEEKFGKPEGAYYKLSVAWFKYWIEWPTIGVYKIASMMIFTALLGGDLPGLGEKLRKRFLLTWLRSLQVWPIYDTILYAYVPASHRPLFNTFMSIIWGGYLSHLSQAEVEELPMSAAAVPEPAAKPVKEEKKVVKEEKKVVVEEKEEEAAPAAAEQEAAAEEEAASEEAASAVEEGSVAEESVGTDAASWSSDEEEEAGAAKVEL